MEIKKGREEAQNALDTISEEIQALEEREPKLSDQELNQQSSALHEKLKAFYDTTVSPHKGQYDQFWEEMLIRTNSLSGRVALVTNRVRPKNTR